MKYYAVLKDGKETKQVWTPANGTFTLSYQGFINIVYPEDGSEIPIRDAVELAKPELMIITLGVNGVSFMDEEYFKSEYSDLVSDIMEISPETKVILQSIFPVASNYGKLEKINNEKIVKANSWVLEVAEETGAKYLDTISVLTDGDGYLISDYQNGDGMHLNAKGFNAVLDYIRTHGWQ
jgi:lysophospholipase L1-like esterase